jgi:hypothetical protein
LKIIFIRTFSYLCEKNSGMHTTDWKASAQKWKKKAVASIDYFCKKSIIFMTSIFFVFTTINISAKPLCERIRFASIDTAKILLMTEDVYTKNWGRFDIESRMQKNGATKEELLAFISEESVQEWTLEEKKIALNAINKFDSVMKMQNLDLPFPDEIYFIRDKITKELKGEGCAYTRRNFTVLNTRESLIFHELFHILSRNNKDFRAQLYSIIGFKMMEEELLLLQDMKDMQMLNPDSPIIDSYITVKKDGISIDCVMWPYSQESYHGGFRMKYKEVGLIKLNNKKEIACDENGKPIIYSIYDVTGFFEQVGENTLYIDQPEEILAVNFQQLISGDTDLKSPWLIEKMKETMKKWRYGK